MSTPLAAAEALAEYGYGLNMQGQILSRDGKASGAHLKHVKHRTQVRTDARDSLLWSGPADKLGEFVAAFWLAEKVTA